MESLKLRAETTTKGHAGISIIVAGSLFLLFSSHLVIHPHEIGSASLKCGLTLRHELIPIYKDALTNPEGFGVDRRDTAEQFTRQIRESVLAHLNSWSEIKLNTSEVHE